MHVKMGISTFKTFVQRLETVHIIRRSVSPIVIIFIQTATKHLRLKLCLYHVEPNFFRGAKIKSFETSWEKITNREWTQA